MKEFVYYNSMLDEFKNLYFHFKNLDTSSKQRYLAGIDDYELTRTIDFFLTSMANLTSYNNIEDFYLLQELYENDDPIIINDKQFTVNTIEDLFDLAFARNFEENLFHIYDKYKEFGPLREDAVLFLTYDNEYIDELYTEEELGQIAEDIQAYIGDETIKARYNGDMFFIEQEIIEEEY